MKMKRGRRSVRRRPTLPDGDDILAEILLRLPPRPSSLPRAGLVCKRWRRLVADPRFLLRFRAFHHRTPPIHGFFLSDGRFFPTQDPPDRVPPWRFSLDRLCREPPHAGNGWSIHCCRHGLVLCGRRPDDFAAGELMVVDPMTGDRSRVAITDEHKQDSLIAAAVVAVAAAGDDVHRRRRPFLVVALFAQRYDTRLTASVYSSDSGAWSVSVSDLSTPSPIMISIVKPSSLVGDAIYWFLLDGEIVRFDLETQSLGIIEQPPVVADDVGGFMFWNDCRRWIVPAAGRGDDRFCLVILSGISIEFWEREAETELGGGAAEWALRRSVELGKVLPMRLKERVQPLAIMGFAEERNVMFVFTLDGVFMGDVESMQFKKVFGRPIICNVHPYSSF